MFPPPHISTESHSIIGTRLSKVVSSALIQKFLMLTFFTPIASEMRTLGKSAFKAPLSSISSKVRYSFQKADIVLIANVNANKSVFISIPFVLNNYYLITPTYLIHTQFSMLIEITSRYKGAQACRLYRL